MIYRYNDAILFTDETDRLNIYSICKMLNVVVRTEEDSKLYYEKGLESAIFIGKHNFYLNRGYPKLTEAIENLLQIKFEL